MERFFTLPRPIRFAVVGSGGLAIGFVVYNVIYWLNPFEPRATIAWIVASLLGVMRQHWLHKQLTFNYAGRDFRLTDVSGRVIREIVT